MSRCILDKIITIICVQSRTPTCKTSNSCPALHRNDRRNTIPWMRTTLLNDRAVKLSKERVHVFSDSVLCLGRIHEYPRSIETWRENTEWFTKSHEYREVDCIDGEPVEFEWTTFPRHTYCSCSERSERRWMRTEFSLNSSEIELSSCRCITTSI